MKQLKAKTSTKKQLKIHSPHTKILNVNVQKNIFEMFPSQIHISIQRAKTIQNIFVKTNTPKIFITQKQNRKNK